ncbi:NAD(P)H-binding protein [Roseomonas stagni]|uniref:NAD(P)H-binding protein n=1 Tax=Falsiroseomonas algicola TaxID=2716930 RepID=A0A6M1LSB4_9PROT|nr:NAD(P)H-binding protein [Falsiroseomonas algicola]NGM22474.1 NAD(P)H-binding protein [Falsiroseomonas algicola]
MPETLLVTGASGQLGRLALDHLATLHRGPIVAGTRDPAKLADLAARGIEARRLDFDDAASLAEGFRGIDRALIVSTDALDRPGRRLAQHRAAVEAAARAGVRHLLYTSMPNPEPGSPVVFAADHHGTEEAIRATGLPHTILRVSWYQENLLASLPGILASGVWASAAGEGRVAYVARQDAARAAAAALAAGGEGRQTLDVTGPAGWSVAELAALVTRIFGRPVQVAAVEDAALATGLASHGVPPFLVPVLVSFDRNTREGRMPAPTGVVARLTGAAPRTLEAFLESRKGALAAAA